MNLAGIIKSIRDIMWTDTGLNGDAQRIEQLGWMLFFKIFCDKEEELDVLREDYQYVVPEELRWSKWASKEEGITGDALREFVDNTLFKELRDLEVANNPRALLLRDVFAGNNNYMKSGTNLRKVLNELNKINFTVAKDRHTFGDLYESFLKELQSAGKSGEFYTPRPVTQFIIDMLNPQLGETVLDPACGTGGFLTCAVEHLRKQTRNADDVAILQDTIRGREYKPLPYLLATTNLILHDIDVPHILFGDVLARPYNEYTQKDRVHIIAANPPFGGIVANGNESNFPAQYRTKESADLFLVLIMHLLKENGRAGIVLPDGSLTGEGIKQRVRKHLLDTCNLHTIIRLPNSVFQPYATVATNILFFEKGSPTKEIWYYEHQLPEGQKSYSKTKPIRLEEFDTIRQWWTRRAESNVSWRVDIDTIVGRNYDLDIKNPHKQEIVHEYTSAELMQQLQQSFEVSKTLLEQLYKSLS